MSPARARSASAAIRPRHCRCWMQCNPCACANWSGSGPEGAPAATRSWRPAALARALAAAPVDPATIGFELREATCLSHRRQAEKLLAQCEQSRCFAVIDDFTFNTGVLELLRSSA